MPQSSRELPPAPGMRLTDDGAEFSVYAGHADAVSLLLIDGPDRGAPRREIPLTERAHGWWFGTIPGVRAGQRYALRSDGPRDAGAGHHYNPDALLLDPYARAIDNQGIATVVTGDFDWSGDVRPQRRWSDTVVYEAHVRGLTMRHPGVPAHLRGTFAGVAHPVVIEHLRSLGVTAIELLPVHALLSESMLVAKGLGNYWGYNSLGFFAPEPRYAAARDAEGILAEFKGMVKLLHQAGIEVLLDVVYNHTAEQGSRGGHTLSWRGLDNRAYYRLDAGGREVDFTGCGNTLDLRHPVVVRQVLDSLRYWVQECHVDGFRFDLAVALCRGRDDAFDPDHAFLVALRSDPILATTKLIAEPWDVGPYGWRTGAFPPPFAEWNDRYRDDVRTFWLTDVAAQFGNHQRHGVRDLATRLAGSADFFAAHDRGPLASVNFVTAHDGFTLADLTAYNEKHNESNGEGNRDGSTHNRSWNHGVEGPSDDQNVLDWRRRAMRNLLGTLLLSQGVPMINAGDEFGRSQHGNNNPYCQDNELTWFNWQHKPWQQALMATTAHLTSLRRQFPVLRQRHFLTGAESSGGVRDVAWYGADGLPMSAAAWDNSATSVLQMLLHSTDPQETGLLLVVNGGINESTVTLPGGADAAYELLWNSADEWPGEPGPRRGPSPIAVAPTTMQIWGCPTPA